MAWAELTDCRCYYELEGQGDPLLLIPGLGRTCRMWDPIAGAMAEHFTLLKIDNRGLGQSKSKHNPRTLRDFSADLIELLEHLQIDRAHILGISLGGVIAQRFVADHPNRVRSLVLISTAYRFGPYLREMAKIVGETMRRFPPTLFAQTLALLGSSPAFLDTVLAQNKPPDVERVKRSALVRQLRCLATADGPRDDFQIKAPTLVIAGEFDALIPSYYARQMAQAIKHSRFLLIPDAGHNPLRECPDRVLPLIVSFLRDGRMQTLDPPPRTGPDREAA